MKSSLGPKRSERDILSSCLRLLKANGIFAIRMNTGAMKIGGRYVRFGLAGMADILTIRSIPVEGLTFQQVAWIECKREGGKQSPEQKLFASIVTNYGHGYYVVHSAAELSHLL